MTLVDQEHAAAIMVGDGGHLEGYCKQEQSVVLFYYGRLCEKFLYFPSGTSYYPWEAADDTEHGPLFPR